MASGEIGGATASGEIGGSVRETYGEGAGSVAVYGASDKSMDANAVGGPSVDSPGADDEESRIRRMLRQSGLGPSETGCAQPPPTPTSVVANVIDSRPSTCDDDPRLSACPDHRSSSWADHRLSACAHHRPVSETTDDELRPGQQQQLSVIATAPRPPDRKVVPPWSVDSIWKDDVSWNPPATDHWRAPPMPPPPRRQGPPTPPTVIADEPICGAWFVAATVLFGLSIFMIASALAGFPWQALAPLAAALPLSMLFVWSSLTSCCVKFVDGAAAARRASDADLCFVECCNCLCDWADPCATPAWRATPARPSQRRGSRALRVRRTFWAAVVLTVATLIGFLIGFTSVPSGQLASLALTASNGGATGQLLLPWCPPSRCQTISARSNSGGASFTPTIDCAGRFYAPASQINDSIQYAGVKMRCGSAFFQWPVDSFAVGSSPVNAQIVQADTIAANGTLFFAVTLGTLIVLAATLACVLCDPDHDCPVGDPRHPQPCCLPACQACCGPRSDATECCRRQCADFANPLPMFPFSINL